MTEISGNGPKQVVATIVFFDIIGQRRYTQVSRWMRPVIFDILWEGDSAAIPLYRGHHLAGPGVPVRISANIQYIDRNGNLYTEKDFSFRWEVESLFHEDEGPGVSAIVYEDGADYLNRFISVKSYARLINEPSIAFEEFISIPVSEPRVLPYSHTLLHGLSHLTVPENTLLNRQPFTISVYPFYFSRSDFEKNAIQYSWFVNNSPAPVKKGRKLIFPLTGGVFPYRYFLSLKMTTPAYKRLNIVFLSLCSVFFLSAGYAYAQGESCTLPPGERVDCHSDCSKSCEDIPFSALRRGDCYRFCTQKCSTVKRYTCDYPRSAAATPVLNA